MYLINKIIHFIDQYHVKKEDGFPTIRGREEAYTLFNIDDPLLFEKKFQAMLERRGVPDWSDEHGNGFLYPMISYLLAEADKEKYDLMMGIGYNTCVENLPEPIVEKTESLAKIEWMKFNAQPTYIQALKNENAWNQKREHDWVQTYKNCWVRMYMYEHKHKDKYELSNWVRQHLHIDNIFLIHLYTLKNPSKKYPVNFHKLKNIYLSNPNVPLWAKMIIQRVGQNYKNVLSSKEIPLKTTEPV
jgi:hypothetical protein